MTIRKFWRYGSALFTIIFVLILAVSEAQAQVWTASITTKSFDPRLPTPISVEFGINPESTNGIDPGLDVITILPPLPPPPNPYLQVAFAGPGMSYLSTDIRPEGPWKLIVGSSDRFTLTWDISSVPTDIALVMVSSDGRTIDMRATTSENFEKGSYSMIIKIPAQITKVEPFTGSKDMDITVEGINFGANEQVTIDFGTAIAMATKTTDVNGSFSVTFPITVAQPNGPVTITATGVTSGQQAKDSTFIYSGPRITSVTVTGSPAKTGETITVTLKGETEGVAKFSIEEAIADSPMVEDPPGVYTGEYVAEEDINVIDAIVTVVLTDSAGNILIDTTQKVTIRSFVDFTLSLSKGINMISAPLDTTSVVVDGEIIERPIKKASDLTAVLGGNVSLIIWYDTEQQKFVSFIPGMPEDSPANVEIGRSTGLIAAMKNPKSITFRGNGWPPGPVELEQCINLISIPLKDPHLTRVSDLANVLGDKMSLIITYNVAQGKFQSFTPTTPPGTLADVPIEGGKSLIVVMKDAAIFDVAGEPWENPSPPPIPHALPPNGETSLLAIDGSVFYDDGATLVPNGETSLLAIDGSVFYDDGTTLVPNGWNVDVTNKTQGLSQSSKTGDAGDGRYSVTFIDISNGIVAATGDEIEIVITDADGNEHSLTYILTDEDIDACAAIIAIDVVTDVPQIVGDVSGDGTVTPYDAALVLQYVVGLIRFTKTQKDAGDVSGNDTITALDAALILQYTVGLITQFPVQGTPIRTTK